MGHKKSIVVFIVALLCSVLTHANDGAQHHSGCAPQTLVMVQAGTLVAIKDLSAVMKVIALSQEQTEPHTFFITPLCILTHNASIDPTFLGNNVLCFSSAAISSCAETALLLAASPQPLSVVLVPALVTGITLGYATYHIFKSLAYYAQKIKTQKVLATAASVASEIQDYLACALCNNKTKIDNINQRIEQAVKQKKVCCKPCPCECHRPRRSAQAGECAQESCGQQHPNGRYAAKNDHPHNGVTNGHKSAGLNNFAGQVLLDRALSFDKSGKLLIGIFEQTAAFFRATRPHVNPSKRLYHGYVVDLKKEWSRIKRGERDFLQEKYICDSKGNVINSKRDLLEKKYCCLCVKNKQS